MTEQVIGYHGMFEEYVPTIRRLHAAGKSPSEIAASLPMVGEGVWRTQCSPQMIIYIMRRERIGVEPSAFYPDIASNDAFFADFRRRTAKWDRMTATWFELHAEKLFLEVAAIVKALEQRRDGKD